MKGKNKGKGKIRVCIAVITKKPVNTKLASDSSF